jgi:23S rRNA pseudouridine2605 synthase
LGREVSEQAVLRAITELWQQLRIIPVIAAPGQTPKWQLLRVRYQKAIAEGASTSQVTAISVLASISLQAVIAATMEDVELFLAPLTARSKVREVLRGLVATRQVHTISLGHAPHFYVAGTLPEFAVAPTVYASSSMPASSYFLHSHEREEETIDRWGHSPTTSFSYQQAKPAAPPQPAPAKAPESHSPRLPTARTQASTQKSSSARPHFSRPAAHSRDRKPAQSSSSGRTARRSSSESSSRSSSRTVARSSKSSRNGSSTRWSKSGSRTSSNGHRSNGKSPAGAVSQRNGHGSKPAKNEAPARKGSLMRKSSTPRKDVRASARSSRPARKPALSAGAKAGNSKRYGFTAPAKPRTKKRG